MHDFSEDQVRLGRELVARESRCKWELGDLALEVAPLQQHGGKRDRDAEDQVATHLNRFADQIGASYASLDRYRQVAARWIKPTRVDLSWSMHRALAGLDDREDVIAQAVAERWTVRDAEEYVRGLRPEAQQDDYERDEWEGSDVVELCPVCAHSVELAWGKP